MRKEKIKLYIFEFIMIFVLFFTLFASSIISKIILSLIFVAFFVVMQFAFRRKPKQNINEKKVLVLMLIFGVLYIGCFYLMGLYYGFVNSKYLLIKSNVIRLIIPTTIIIVLSELIRERLLCQDSKLEIKGKKINISYFLVFLIMTLTDLSLYLGIYDLRKIDDFLLVLGFIFFASVSCNILYNYISKRYGSKGIIGYRLLTVLYLYLIPIVPNVYILMRIFFRILIPLLIYIILELSFSKKNRAVSTVDKKKSIIYGVAVFTVVVSFIMLISCQFKYGVIVIGSRSMTGSINKGDAVIYRQYKDESLKKGQIIIFNYNGIKTVHRIVEIRNVNGERRYITKGDNNKNNDTGYRNEKNIYGIVRVRIKYIGLPTLWFRSLFD